MTTDAWLVLGVVLVVLVLLVRDIASPATTMVGAMVVVLVTGAAGDPQAL